MTLKQEVKVQLYFKKSFNHTLDTGAQDIVCLTWTAKFKRKKSTHIEGQFENVVTLQVIHVYGKQHGSEIKQ